MNTSNAFVLLAAASVLVACAPKEAAPVTDTAQAAPTTTVSPAAVEITTPATGDTVAVPFTVTLVASGVEVIPADGSVVEGKGHHHLLIDSDVASDTLPVPGAPAAIHMGNGASEFEIKELAPGPHRIITVFAYGNHVPMTTVKRDTIDIVVK
jgi:hypothetical protein